MPKKLTIEQVNEFLDTIEYRLIDEYNGCSNKSLYQCDKGHIVDMRLSDLKKGHRCRKCSGIDKRSIVYVREKVREFGYDVLSHTYIDNKTKLRFLCDSGHEFDMRFDSIMNGQRCPECYRETYIPNLATKRLLSVEKVNEILDKMGYTLLSKYTGLQKVVDIRCNKGHIFKGRLDNIKYGHECGICNALKQTSRPEQEVKDYVKTIYAHNFIENDRTVIKNPGSGYYMELDLWFPGSNKAIEYNGNFWHGDRRNKSKDAIKAEECKRLGIELLVITEFDWYNERPKTERKIKSFLLGEQ